MVKNYRFYNNSIGWLVFLIATITYFLTLEPTASWWDCGEYIATAYKLQVGHPPGAPTFQLLGRIFSLFAFGDTANVALMINGLSALSSSFTVLFLFWTITMLAKKLVVRNREMSAGDSIAVFGAGIIGSLVFAFSDSFWFSAVEGEVYAMSSMFTAIVFWAILKWEAEDEQGKSWRWIILIAYLMGLSIGVHLLNLLAIPAIGYVYYYKNTAKPTIKGLLKTGVVSIIVLAVLMYVIIPWTVLLAQKFELFFVNQLGLPFNTGTVIYFVLLIGGLVFGIRYTSKKKKVIGNVILLSLTFILIGYSTFFILVIRANAGTPINENAPKDAISLLSYLNREQYGTWPLFSGQHYNSPVSDYGDNSPIYVKDKKKGKYVITDSRVNTKPVYDKQFTTIFPRMYSGRDQKHIKGYKAWGEVKGTPRKHKKPDGTFETIYKPTFGENLKFFFSYQVGHMYLRYLMWNFSGRQNDIESQGAITQGNWITGFDFIDNARLGSQDDLPHSMQNPANNKFYMLPFLLGLIGLFFQMSKDNKNAWVVATLYLMTGLAIIVFLNQTPYQPRERDYAYTGSFYAFAIWIGFGMLGIYDFLQGYLKNNKKLVAIVITILCLFVPVLMAQQGWDDHDRSGKYAARDYAANYLNSCPPNAILFTNGDNDTFPLWYAQEVEGIRRDVRVVNYMLSSGYWYVQQMKKKVYESDPLPLTLSAKQYENGVNDVVVVRDMNTSGKTVTVQDAIKYLANDDNKQSFGTSGMLSMLPVKSLRIPVPKEKFFKKVKSDSAEVADKWVAVEGATKFVPLDKMDKVVDHIDFKIKKGLLYKNDLMLLDLIATNNWERPICFANPSAAHSEVMDIEKYCHLTGLVYRFLPYEADGYMRRMGGIDADTSYDIVMNNFKWGNLEREDVTIDRESMRNSGAPKNIFVRLSQQLLLQGEKEKAIKVIDTCLYYFPDEKIPFDYYMIPLASIAYESGSDERGDYISQKVFDNFVGNLNYYLKQDKYADYYSKDMEQEFGYLYHLRQLVDEYKRTELVKEIDKFLNDFQQRIELLYGGV